MSRWPRGCPVGTQDHDTGRGGPMAPALHALHVWMDSGLCLSLAEPNERPDYQSPPIIIILIPSSKVTSVMLGKNLF